jgi:hypothetical protein
LANSTTKTEVKADRKALVTLRFAGDELDPREISAILPVKPTRAHKKGEEFVAGPNAGKLRGRTGIWFLATDKLVDSDDLTDHLRFRAGPPLSGAKRQGAYCKASQAVGALALPRPRHLLLTRDYGDVAPQIPTQFRSAIKPLATDIETETRRVG